MNLLAERAPLMMFFRRVSINRRLKRLRQNRLQSQKIGSTPLTEASYKL